MLTYYAEPWVRSFLPPDAVPITRGHFDIVRAVDRVSFTDVPGLEHIGIVAFDFRLNIVSGTLGKTRLLERVKSVSGPAPELPPIPRTKDDSLSSGQWLMLVLEQILRIPPAGTCLLLDDLLDHLDRPHQQAVLGLLRAHPRQSVMTVKSRLLDEVMSAFLDAGVSTSALIPSSTLVPWTCEKSGVVLLCALQSTASMKRDTKTRKFPEGQCALCREDGVLRFSHIIPELIYRPMYDETSLHAGTSQEAQGHASPKGFP